MSDQATLLSDEQLNQMYAGLSDNELAALCRKEMEQRGLTQAAVARRMRGSQGRVSAVLRGAGRKRGRCLYLLRILHAMNNPLAPTEKQERHPQPEAFTEAISFWSGRVKKHEQYFRRQLRKLANDANVSCT